MKLRQHVVRQGLLGGMLLLAGCGLPPVIVVASYALDGVSYVATGKSVTDHAISAVSGQDCALHRLLTAAGEVCNETFDEIFTADAGDTLAPGEVSVGAKALVETAIVGDTRPAAEPAAMTGPYGGVPARDEPGERYLVLGSFADPDNAGRLAEKLAGMDAAAVTTDVKGRTMHRVVVPAVWQGDVAAAGFDDAWPVDLCPGTLTAAPCAAVPAITLLAAVPR